MDQRQVGAGGLAPLIPRLRGALLSNAAFLIANTLSGSAFGFLFWVVAARAFTPAQVGLGAAYIAALTFLATLGEMGLGTALIRFAPSAGPAQTPFINSALVGVGASTLGAALLFGLGTPLWSPDLDALARPNIALGLFLASTLAFGLAQLLDRVFVAFEVTHFMFLRNLVANLGRLLLVVTLAPALGAVGLLFAVGAAALVSFGLSLLVFVPRTLPAYRARLTFAWPFLRDKLHYTLGNHLAVLLWNAPALTYPLIVLSLLGADANAHFYISWMIANLLFVVPTAVSTSAFARASNQGQMQDDIFWRSMRHTLLGLVPCAGLLALAAPLVLGVFGRSYGQAGSGLFILLVLSVFPYTLNTYVITYHRIKQNVGGVVAVSGIITGLCLALSAVCGSLYGLPGIGVGWLAGQIAGTGLALLSRRARTPAGVAPESAGPPSWIAEKS